MIVRRIAELWWLRLPLAGRRVSRIGSGALMDGYAVMSFPWLAAVASPIVVAVGFVAGRDSMGYEFLFTESLALLLTFVAIGTVSAHYGLLFTLGFAVGDFFFHHHEWENQIRFVNRDDGFWDHVVSFRVPMVVLYLSLGLVTVIAPMAAKTLTAQFVVGPKPVRFIVAMAGHAAISGAFAYLWSQALPVVMRPVFYWSTSGSPYTRAVEPAQTNGSAFITVAVIFSLARLLVQVVAATATIPRVRQDLWADSIQSAEPAESLYSRLPAIVRAALSAALITLMMAGLFLTWGDAWVIAAIAFGLALVRTGALPIPIGAFRRLVGRVPLLLRLGLGVYIIWRVAVSEIGFRPTGETFQPAIFVVGVSMIVFFLLNPGGSEEER